MTKATKELSLPQNSKKSASRRDILLYIGAFFIPMTVMFLIYAAMEVWPIGNGSVLVLDLNGQYVYFFEELRAKLVGGGSLLYSWGRALGGEFLGIFAYYIASPFSILVALFPKGMITEALLTIILLKVGSCGLSMAVYMKKTHPTTTLNTLVFSAMYAVCSYAVVQAHNTMWIDEMIFLPILVMGIEMLIRERRCVLYIAALAFSLMTSFYIGYMMCLFTLLYFFYFYFSRSDYENNLYCEEYHFVKTFLRIGFSTLLAVGIALVVLFPAYVSLQFGKSTFSTTDWSFVQRFDFLDFIAKLFPGSYDTVRPEGLPFVYCGLLTLLMLPLYFIAPGIRVREKVGSGIFAVALILCFNGSSIDIVWHGFQEPNWLNYRYSFAFCFFIVYLAYKAFGEIERISYRSLLVVAAGLGLLLLMIQKQDYEWLGDFSCIWLSFGFLALYVVLLHPIAKKKLAVYGKSVLLVAVCAELFVSGLLDDVALDNDVVYSSRTSYVSYMNKLQPVVDFVKDYDAENHQNVFYRMEKNSHRKTNDPMALGFYGISNSTSTLNSSVISLLAKLGYTSKSHWSKYLGGTPVSDSLLDIRYVIRTDDYDGPFYRQIYADNDTELYGYENPYALSLAYGVSEDVYNILLDDYDTPFDFINDLASAMLGEEDFKVFRRIRVSDVSYENLEVTFTTDHKKYTPVSENRTSRLIFKFAADSSDEIYCFFPSTWKREVEFSCNGQEMGTFFGNESYCIKALGSFEEGDEVICTMTLKDSNLYIRSGCDYFFYLDPEAYARFTDALLPNCLNITDFYDTDIRGSVTLDDAHTTVFTSIPYDEGWQVTVDGETVPLQKTLGALLAFDCTPGTHEIRLRYMPKCYVVGLSVSCVSLVIFAGVIALDYILRRRRQKQIDARYRALSEGRYDELS